MEQSRQNYKVHDLRIIPEDMQSKSGSRGSKDDISDTRQQDTVSKVTDHEEGRLRKKVKQKGHTRKKSDITPRAKVKLRSSSIINNSSCINHSGIISKKTTFTSKNNSEIEKFSKNSTKQSAGKTGTTKKKHLTSTYQLSKTPIIKKESKRNSIYSPHVFGRKKEQVTEKHIVIKKEPIVDRKQSKQSKEQSEKYKQISQKYRELAMKYKQPSIKYKQLIYRK